MEPFHHKDIEGILRYFILSFNYFKFSIKMFADFQVKYCEFYSHIELNMIQYPFYHFVGSKNP